MKKITFLLLTLLFFTSYAWSQCESALALTPGTTQTGNTSSFGDLFDDNSCLGYYDGGDDALFVYTASQTGETMNVSLTGADTWTGISMTLGCPTGSGYSCVGSSTYGSSQSFTSDPLVAGEIYYIHISTYPAPYDTNYNLDTEVVAAPACPDPTGLQTSLITTSSAELSWTAGDSETLWNIEVVDVTAGETADGSVDYTSSANSYSLTSLSSNNEYEVYVQADCGAGETSSWVSLSFTTSPGCGDTVTHCYEGGTYSIFDATVDSTGDYITATILTGDTESCCDTLIIYDSSDDSGNVLYSANGDHSGQVITSTTGIISVWIDADGSWDCDDGSGGPYDQISVELSCTPPPSCIAPTAITASNVLTTSADLSWTAGGNETDYEYVVQEPGTGEPTTAGEAVTGATSVFVGLLSANTAYEVYVRSACSGEFSDWSDVFNFTTSTDPLIVGADCLDFEIGGLGSSAGLTENTQSSASLVATAGNASSSGIVLTGGSSGTNWTGFSTSTTETNAWVDNVLHQSAVVMEVDATTESTVVLTFDLKQTYSYGYTYSNFRVTVNDTQIGSTLYPSTDSSDPFVNQNYDLSAYAGTSFTLKLEFSGKYSDEYAASYGLAGDTAYVDNICVTAPSCLAPTALVVENITDSSADVSWTAGDSETLWNIEVVDVTAGGTATGSATYSGVSNPHLLTGLSSNNEYEVYVQADCGVDGTSEWSVAASFTTDCAVFSQSYNHGFVADNNGIVADASCWAVINQGSTNGWGLMQDTTTGNVYWNLTYSSVQHSDWLISPTFTVTDNLTDAFAFDGWNGNPSWGNEVIDVLVYDTDLTLLGTLATDLSLPAESEDTNFVYDLSSYENQDIRIAFYSSTEYLSYSRIDNFQVDSYTSLGVEDNSISLFNYFPNPVNDVLTIKAQKDVDNITVYNMLGQVVKRQTPNTRDCTVDLSAMQTGAYFVQVSIDNSVETVRILKN